MVPDPKIYGEKHIRHHSRFEYNDRRLSRREFAQLQTMPLGFSRIGRDVRSNIHEYGGRDGKPGFTGTTVRLDSANTLVSECSVVCGG